MELQVPLSDMDFGPEEEQAAVEVIHNRWLTMGAVTQQFEREFTSLVGVKHSLALSNCTQALHLACVALGIGPGDEVIVPSLSFVATSNAVLYTGADVRFAEIIGLDDLTISPTDIEEKITPRTKAIIVMHYAGYPCRMAEIMEIAQRHKLAVIEDSAHAPGARLSDIALGAWGDIGCFSFFSNKNLATGEGGMLVTNREDIAQKVGYLRSHGMTTLTWDRHKGHAHTYDVVDLGYNDRIDEIRSAIGLVQLHKLEKNNARRKWITEYYRKELAGLRSLGLEIPFLNVPGEPAFHIFPILLPIGCDQRTFMDAMRSQGVQTSIHYPPIHTFSYYRQRYPGVSLPVTESIARREVTLPLYPGMKESDVKLVIAAVKQAVHIAMKHQPADTIPIH